MSKPRDGASFYRQYNKSIAKENDKQRSQDIINNFRQKQGLGEVNKLEKAKAKKI